MLSPLSAASRRPVVGACLALLCSCSSTTAIDADSGTAAADGGPNARDGALEGVDGAVVEACTVVEMPPAVHDSVLLDDQADTMSDEYKAIAFGLRDSQGRTVVVASGYVPVWEPDPGDYVFLNRTTATGALDTSYGDAGFARIKNPAHASSHWVSNVAGAAGSAGDVLVAVTVEPVVHGDSWVVLYRVLEDGEVDPTFGDDGVLALLDDDSCDLTGDIEPAVVVAGSDGYLFAEIRCPGSSPEYRHIGVRFDASTGTVDPSFGYDVAVPALDTTGLMRARSRGEVIYAGASYHLARFQNGVRDLSFSGAGLFTGRFSNFGIGTGGELLLVGLTYGSGVHVLDDDGLEELLERPDGYTITAVTERCDGRILLSLWSESEYRYAAALLDESNAFDLDRGEGGLVSGSIDGVAGAPEPVFDPATGRVNLLMQDNSTRRYYSVAVDP